MRTIPISATRSVKIENLLPEFRKKIPADHKGTDFAFSAGPKDRQVPENLDEAIQTLGKDKVFDTFMKQLRTDLGNELAQDILDKVCDPKKAGRKAATAIEVEL